MSGKNVVTTTEQNTSLRKTVLMNSKNVDIARPAGWDQRKLNEDIDNWLKEHNAELIAEMRIPTWREPRNARGAKQQCQVALYQIDNSTVVVERWRKGWKLYIPASSGNDISESLAKADRSICNNGPILA